MNAFVVDELCFELRRSPRRSTVQVTVDRFGEERRARLIKQRNLQPARLFGQPLYSAPPAEPNPDDAPRTSTQGASAEPAIGGR